MPPDHPSILGGGDHSGSSSSETILFKTLPIHVNINIIQIESALSFGWIRVFLNPLALSYIIVTRRDFLRKEKKEK